MKPAVPDALRQLDKKACKVYVECGGSVHNAGLYFLGYVHGLGTREEDLSKGRERFVDPMFQMGYEDGKGDREALSL